VLADVGFRLRRVPLEFEPAVYVVTIRPRRMLRKRMAAIGSVPVLPESIA
jgi:hypothetical protein